MSAQGKATRVTRALPPPWVACALIRQPCKGETGEKIGVVVVAPLQGWGRWRHRYPGRRSAAHAATLCPGLTCSGPFGAIAPLSAPLGQPGGSAGFCRTSPRVSAWGCKAPITKRTCSSRSTPNSSTLERMISRSTLAAKALSFSEGHGRPRGKRFQNGSCTRQSAGKPASWRTQLRPGHSSSSMVCSNRSWPPAIVIWPLPQAGQCRISSATGWCAPHAWH
jgi:hypothetical protein